MWPELLLNRFQTSEEDVVIEYFVGTGNKINISWSANLNSSCTDSREVEEVFKSGCFS